jgi:tetratricopeptide (TPR) repeat protein
MHALALTRTATGMRNAPDDAARLIEDARASARLALRLKPREAKAYVALSNTYLFAPNAPNWVEMERNLKRALELDPELTQARLGYAWILLEVGRTEAALDAFAGLTRAADPRARSNLLLVAATQASLGNRGAADAMVERLARTYPEQARDAEWGITIWWEDVGVARSKLRMMARGSAPLERQVACIDKYLSGLARRGAAAIRGLPSECAVVSPDWRFRMLARQGDLDAAYALFEARRTDFIITQFTKMLFFPEMREFRRDRRFMPLAKKIGLVDYWLATGKWPDFCAEPDLPYDCRAAARAA